MRFVDMFILGNLDGERRILYLFLLNLKSLREQFNSRCHGITPERVKESIHNLCASREVMLGKFDEAGNFRQVDENQLASSLLTLRRQSVDEVEAERWGVQMTRKGFDAWSAWSKYDWENHAETAEYEITDHLTIGGGTIAIRSASWSRMLFEIRHLPDKWNCLIVPYGAEFSVEKNWNVQPFMTLPFCFQLRSNITSLVTMTHDVELRQHEKAADWLCDKITAICAKWESEGCDDSIVGANVRFVELLKNG